MTQGDAQQAWLELAHAVAENALKSYGARLLTFAVFGSVARGAARADSDLDCLLVVDPLPDGRGARLREFEVVDRLSETAVQDAWSKGISADISPIFKTPEEMNYGSPLMLDMTEHLLFLFDRDSTTRDLIDDFRHRLDKAGAVKVRQGLQWYWDLKPDFKPGDTIKI